jgi:hypothetical protein
MKNSWNPLLLIFLGLAVIFCSGCQSLSAAAEAPGEPSPREEAAGEGSSQPADSPQATPLPERPDFGPAQLVDYIAQTGDTLPALAAHFNTTVEEILEANSFIPADATTLPAGMPMQIPIYFAPFLGSAFKILPDSLFINGPSQIEFDTQGFVDSREGWLKRYHAYVAGANRSGAGIVNYVARNFSISPRLLLAILEYQLGALSQPKLPQNIDEYPLGYEDLAHHGLYLQLVWAANALNDGYYHWRTGRVMIIDLADGSIERPDPWQNAASVALQVYFSLEHDNDGYLQATGPDGLARVYTTLFGDPWQNNQSHIPGSLQQPEMLLPFEEGKRWAYTGGPHTGWGTGEPFAALDFAPPSVLGGCTPSGEWNTAVAPGVVVRSEKGIVELDLDGDGDPRTGWTVFYLHVGTQDRVPVGTVLEAGDPIGHPSCEGGRTTGTHIHIARKYNGEWILAEGALAFNLEGWIAHNGDYPYQGTLTRLSETVIACECSNNDSQLTAGDEGR